MINVKLVGGAKKSFLQDIIQIDKSDVTINELLQIIIEKKPNDTPELDIENILVAVNGTDSSALNGKNTIIKDDDVVSIIPVIHGGSSKKLTFDCCRKNILVVEIKGNKTIDVSFLDELRKKHHKIKIQAVASKYVLNKYHLEKILLLSLESEKKNVLLSKRIETDILMRFALSSQISDAIKNVGMKPGNNFVLIGIGNKKNLEKLSDELSPLCIDLFSKDHTSFLIRKFKISKKEIESVYSKNPLEDLIIEKAAILV